ncbi:hypothetical protein [Jonesia denitrificans]|uniref:Uncharacterized protein n=1 Tax=Jonesia denitrificans (strain ATCC 14870 / DSM 20603 / BCRC 15368 / CIP 55.134 / JCM 11481 / NBRC 15587 / NCTC 10816 / Prevot 55134) TaxID=471856 RepID=C7R1V7_JONDD|nr:hypothetical protein [Jonesia denitrificans]ACV08425.1 hypothetical protein Jden_0762 [Jonesia denitrificans DSM 20603]ASE07929.1 hypothetical protein CEP80_01355 [Jonesia denitrificans]QXB42537.1 hypothetical protein I6L70_08215 [Jonesia denitrificans]SQH20404.1 Uncharacterised protein [Jonesia denitrificans]
MNLFKKRTPVQPQPEQPKITKDIVGKIEDGASILRGLAKLMDIHTGDANYAKRIDDAARALEAFVDEQRAAGAIDIDRSESNPLIALPPRRSTPEEVATWRSVGGQEHYSHMRYKLHLQQ